MAEQRQGDIQRLVRSIVADLMSQEQNTPVEAATSNTSGNRYESIDQELNNSFRIPRGTSRENISGSINLNIAPNADANIAMNFNSRQNYARNQPQRKRQVVRQSATQSRKRNRTTDLNYWIKLLSCIVEANGGHIGLSHINLHWHY